MRDERQGEIVARAREAPTENLPTLLGEIAEADAIIRMRIATTPVQAPARVPEKAEAEHLLTPDEAIAAVGGGVSRKWLLRHTRGLRFRRDLSRKVARFEETGLRRWLSVRKPAI